MINVNYNDQCIHLTLIVGRKIWNNILGRNWINVLHLNRQTLDDLVCNPSIQYLNHGFTNLID